MSQIFVLAEHRKGSLREITWEMLNKGAEVASRSGSELVAVLLGHRADDFAGELAQGADRVLVVEDAQLENYNSEIYQNVLSRLLSEHQPVLTFIGHTAFGMDLAPSLAAEMGMPLSTDCIDVNLEGDKLTTTRQMYGGKVNAEVSFTPAKQYLVTLRSGTFPAEAAATKDGKIEKLDPPPLATDRKNFIEYLEAAIGAVDITQADVLVSVGQGIGDIKNMPLVEELAASLGATLSCSRPVVDRKWLPKEQQVGTSGKTVKPKVYLAIGISGAFQHVAGVKASTIIAINKDPKAPIFRVADYGIVGDLFQVVPLLKDKATALKGS
jgi:electron transfer flavoprotein alpha subunit